MSDLADEPSTDRTTNRRSLLVFVTHPWGTIRRGIPEGFRGTSTGRPKSSASSICNLSVAFIEISVTLVASKLTSRGDWSVARRRCGPRDAVQTDLQQPSRRHLMLLVSSWRLRLFGTRRNLRSLRATSHLGRASALFFLEYYDIEECLFSKVHERFHQDGCLCAFDFFTTVGWKSNRPKGMIREAL